MQEYIASYFTSFLLDCSFLHIFSSFTCVNKELIPLLMITFIFLNTFQMWEFSPMRKTVCGSYTFAGS